MSPVRMPLLVLAWFAIGAAAQQPAQAPVPPPGGYTGEKLGEALRKLGFEVEEKNKEKTLYWIRINRDNRIFTHRVTLNPPLTLLWLETTVGNIDDPANVPPTSMRRLLEENKNIGPAHFTYKTDNKQIELYEGSANSDWTPVKLRKMIDSFDSLARKTEPIWRGDNFVKLWGVPEEIARKELDQLKGEWALKAGWQYGVAITADQIEKSKVRISIQGNKFSYPPLKEPKTAVVDPRRTPKAMDLIESNGRVETCIYKLEENVLTIVTLGVGVVRPDGFDVKPESKTSKLIFNRVKP
jgi:uncharacterized protein (TIGR03067 family)